MIRMHSEDGYNNVDLEGAKPPIEVVHNSRIYIAFSECCSNTGENLTATARRIRDWATNPETQLGFASIVFGLACAAVSVACGSAYSDCLKTDSAACNKKTTTTNCTTRKGVTHCTTTTTSHEEDLLNSSIVFAGASVLSVTAGLYKLCVR